jgi:hypothetical protein
MRTHSICFLSCTLAFVVLCGCSTHKAAVETRRQFAIDRAHQDFRSRSPIFRQFGTNNLSALSSANATTLKTPRLASATIGKDQDGEYRLYVFWLEDKPSVDGLELYLAKTNLTAIIPISSADREENVKSSKVTVVMVARGIWHNTDGIWNKLEKISDVSDLKVRLLKAGVPATEWCPVSFYELDHWMGSKKVTEVTSGSSAGIKAHN